MVFAPTAALHVGYGPEVTVLEYLVRVLLHLSILGGVAILVLWGSRALEAIGSAFVGDGDTNDR